MTTGSGSRLATWYEIQVEVMDRGEVMFGHEWEARVIERFCK